MASRQLAAVARTPEDYLSVYDRVLGQVSWPVILHWLGEAFDPALRRVLGLASTSRPRRRPSSTWCASTATGRRGQGVAAVAPTTRRGCGPRCPPGCASTPATTSTTPSSSAATVAPLRRTARGLRRDRPRRGRGAGRARRRGPRRPTTRRWRRPCRCPGTSSRPPPTTTRRASPSSPGSAGTSPASPWWAACSPRAARCTSARIFELANDARLLPDPDLAAHRLALAPGGGSDPVTRAYACAVDVPAGPRPGADPHPGRPAAGAALAQPEDHRRLVPAGRGRGLRAGGLPAIGVWREPLRRSGSRRLRRWWPTPACGCPRSAGAASSPDRTGREASRRQRPRPRGVRRARGTLPGPRPRRAARRSRDLPAARARVAAAVEALVPRAPRRAGPARHRADAPHLCRRPWRGLDLGPGPRHRRAVPRPGRRGRHRHLPPVVGARRRDAGRPRRRSGRELPGRATGSPRCPPTRCWPAG